jgi:anti-sigma regulatory factor (Ser/Thr protein kinase)
VIPHKTVVYKKSFSIEGKTFRNAGRISGRVKTLLQGMALPEEIVRRAAIVTYEAEINIYSYAERGRIILRVSSKQITIEAIDKGQGIADIALAMQEGYSTSTEKIWHMGFGAGMGLSNMKKFSDVFHIASEVGKGTHLKITINID